MWKTPNQESKGEVWKGEPGETASLAAETPLTPKQEYNVYVFPRN